MAALIRNGTGSTWKITRGDLGRPEVFDLAKSKGRHFGVKLVGLKVSDPGFPQVGHARRAPLMDNLPFR